MIPDRISVSGLLCYRERQEISFEGCALWMLTGPNGSGKSALFDALTFTLFGQHRGGRQNARDLIHHDCQQLRLEVDFTLDGHRYRATRTLSRQGKSTRQLATWIGSSPPDGQWQAIPDTHTEKGYQHWIDTHIALNYETFTASILLLQGRAENLLLATPAQRYRLLSQIAGLDQIEALCRSARHHQAEAQGAVSALRSSTSSPVEITPHQLDALHERTRAAQEECDSSLHAIQQLSADLQLARQWYQLCQSAQEQQLELSQVNGQLADTNDNSPQPAHLIELLSHLDNLALLLRYMQELEACRQAAGSLRAELKEQDAAAQQASTKREQLADSLNKTGEQCAALLHKINTCTVQAREAQQAHETGSALRQVQQRLTQLRESIDTAEQELARVESQQAHCTQHMPTDDEIASAIMAAGDSAAQLARLEAESTHVEAQLKRLRTAARQSVCPSCLQPVSPAHTLREEARLTSRLQQLAQQLDLDRGALHQAETALESARRRQSATRAQLALMGQQTERIRLQLQADDALKKQLIQQSDQHRQRLSEQLRQVGLSTGLSDRSHRDFPADDDLAQLAVAQRASGIELQIARQSLPDMQSQYNDLQTALAHVDALCQQLLSRRTWLERSLAAETGRSAGLEAALHAARQALPASCRALLPDQLASLVAELTEVRRVVAADSQTLESHRDALQRRLEKYQTQHALVTDQISKIPPHARRDPHELDQALQEVTERHRQHQLALHAAQADQQRAIAQRDQELIAQQKLRRAHWQLRLWQRLASLLSDQGLQHDLLQMAELEIVEYANAILDRLASGQLYLEPTATTSRSRSRRSVLDLQVRSTTCPSQPLSISFLSGSQQFRIAVALALAIGQFASSARRPVQSVIIDEGFGCLDSVNRQVMIQELQNLREHLQRIILVSHQDDFASAFPDGYRCELINGSARITAFHP